MNRTPSLAIRSTSSSSTSRGQPVGGDAVAHHPARLGAGVADLDLVPEPRQVIGGREPARPRADHEHALAASHCRRLERPGALARQIAEKPLHRVDRDGAVELRAVAAGLARVVAHPAVDRRKRVVVDEHAPRLLVLSRLHLREPFLDVLPGRARRIARRQEIHVHRALRPNRPRARASVREVWQRSDVPRRIPPRGMPAAQAGVQLAGIAAVASTCPFNLRTAAPGCRRPVAPTKPAVDRPRRQELTAERRSAPTHLYPTPTLPAARTAPDLPFPPVGPPHSCDARPRSGGTCGRCPTGCPPVLIPPGQGLEAAARGGAAWRGGARRRPTR